MKRRDFASLLVFTLVVGIALSHVAEAEGLPSRREPLAPCLRCPPGARPTRRAGRLICVGGRAKARTKKTRKRSTKAAGAHVANHAKCVQSCTLRYARNPRLLTRMKGCLAACSKPSASSKPATRSAPASRTPTKTTSPSRSAASSGGSQQVKAEIKRLEVQLQDLSKKLQKAMKCILPFSRCSSREKANAKRIPQEIKTVRAKLDRALGDLCTRHKDRQACSRLKNAELKSKMRSFLSANRIQFTDSDHRRLQKLADKADFKGFQKTAQSAMKKSFDQAGFACGEHKTRHHCSQHCEMKHGKGFNLLKGPCAAGCHADNKWFKPAFKTMGKWFKDAGKWVEGAVKDVGKFAEKVGKGIVDFLKNPAEALCQTLFAPICPLIKILIAFFKEVVKTKDVFKAFKSLFEKFKKRVERFGKNAMRSFQRLFKSLDDVFSIEHEKQILPRIGKFAKRVISEVGRVVKEFHKFIEMPSFIGEIVGAITGVSIAGAVTPPVALIATISFGARKLMEWLVPKLILGLGDVMGFIKKLPGPVKEVAKTVLNVVKAIVPAAGGLMGALMSKETKARVQAILRKVANVSGKISNGIKGALAVAEQVRSGTFADVEKALGSQAKLPTKLSKEDLGKIISGLVDFAGDQIWLKLEGVLGKVLGKLFSLLDPLLDAARATLIGPVGSIPFVGGVLSSILNVGAGILVTMAKDFIIGKILEFAKKQLDRTVGSMKKALEKQLLRSKGNVKKTKDFVNLLKLVGDVAGEVSAVSKDLSAGMENVMASVGALAATALDKFLLRGIRDPDVRRILSDATGAVLKSFGKKGGFDLSAAVGSVLKQVAKPLSSLVAKAIADTKLRGLVERGLTGLLKGLASGSGVRKIMANPLGFLSSVAKELIVSLKNDLVGLLLGSIKNAQLKSALGAAIGALASTVEKGGFSALLDFPRLLGRLLTALEKPLTTMLLSGISDKNVKGVIQRALSFVLSEVRSKGAASLFQGGLGSLFVRLFEALRDPLLNLLLRDVPSPAIRNAAGKAIDQLISQTRSGNLSQALDVRKAIGGIVRALKPALAEFIAGRIGDASLAGALKSAVGTAVDQGAKLIEGGKFNGIGNLIADLAGPAAQALKGYLTKVIPSPIRELVAKAFDEVVPLLRKDPSSLLREGPRALWGSAVKYLRALYNKAESFAKDKVRQIKDALFSVIDGIQRAPEQIQTIVQSLTSLATAAKGLQLPSL